ncbi:geranylgeranyl diphosphate synthase, type II [Apibacter mensalis]|uniref:Geranylgeranyl diphosphate synthase, type II n=1 Tax=Apibacter mensalis TaxID=1586267 RepID=A0A0X3AR83_9FLAO|nr:polyprenyl synthetase family protein [Apibacter mensalis]CVK16911.1 geranylgeranyl diphosphate synthase, type II [Apibacter mensalis]
MHFLDNYRSIIRDAINKHNLTNPPHQLYDPINYILTLGGKQLRPIILLMSCELFDGNIEKAIKPALGIEYFHNFSLMHDDIMDKATLRRAQETVHVKYNENTAILSGDALMVISFQMLEDLEPHLFKKCFCLFSQTALEVCEGQQYDMNFEKQQIVSFEEYINMITGKTAVLCACAFKMGALIAEAEPDDLKNMYEFGRSLGIAFQLMDDYLDVFGNQKTVGKKHAGDIVENKKTILYVLAQQKADEVQKHKLNYWYTITGENENKVNEVLAVFNELNVGDSCLELVKAYSDQAKNYLNKIRVDTNKKHTFYELVDYLLVRES